MVLGVTLGVTLFVFHHLYRVFFFVVYHFVVFADQPEQIDRSLRPDRDRTVRDIDHGTGRRVMLYRRLHDFFGCHNVFLQIKNRAFLPGAFSGSYVPDLRFCGLRP